MAKKIHTAKKVRTLNSATQALLLHEAQGCGIDDVLGRIEESLTGDEYDAVEAFLIWLKKKDRSFGWNIADVVGDWVKDQRNEIHRKAKRSGS